MARFLLSSLIFPLEFIQNIFRFCDSDSVGLVLTACLRGLYSLTAKAGKGLSGKGPPSSKSLNQLYVLVVCVLMLVQDSAVLQEIVQHEQEASMDWYKERHLKHVSSPRLYFVELLNVYELFIRCHALQASLMDAALLCLLRTVMHALFRLQDQYLLSNACAALHNLSTRMQRTVLPYTAERLVRVLSQLCSRAVKQHDSKM